MKRPRFLATAREDLRVIVERDPSVKGIAEALLHPSLPALWSYRTAHALRRRGLRFVAQVVSVLGRLLSGIEIHPGATVGRRLFIDHGTGVVVGETAVIGDDVTLYHQVTLGAVGWWRDNRRPAGQRRHPAIGNRVVVGTNATILGPVMIGDGAVIGAQAFVVDDVPAGAHVVAPAAIVKPARMPDVPTVAVPEAEPSPDRAVPVHAHEH
ncbi:MAG: serine O-acetyltransferase EpsC [Actinocatenispora sp.]